MPDAPGLELIAGELRDRHPGSVLATNLKVSGVSVFSAGDFMGGEGSEQIVLNDRSGTYRVIYAVQIGDDLWVVHAFQKKSKTGIKTPPQEIELIRQRLKRLKEILA